MDNYIEYLRTIANDFDKNSASMNKSTKNDELEKRELIDLSVYKKVDLRWFKLIFDMYDKMNKVPTREDFEAAFKNDNFNKLSQECQETLKEKYNEFIQNRHYK